MNRLLLSFCLLLAQPLLAQAAWMNPSSWLIRVDGTADGPPGSDSFTDTENVANLFGTRTVAGAADARGTDPDGVPDGTQSSASAEATVAASSLSFSSQLNFDHGTALGFSSDAGAQGQFTFDVTRAVMTSFELTAGGRHRTVGATLKDAADVEVWEVFVPENEIGIEWNDSLLPAQFPFRRDWMLMPGSYTLSLGHSTVPLAGTGGASSFEFRLVPEPGTAPLAALGFLLLYRRRQSAAIASRGPRHSHPGSLRNH